MILQNIDLYPEYLRPKSIVLPFKQGALITLIIAALLIGSSGYLFWEKGVQTVAMAKSKKNLDELEKEITDFENNHTKKELNIGMKKRESFYQKMLDKRQKLLDKLEDSKFGYTEGYSPQLTALARQHVEGLWLTRIYFKERMSELNIKGLTNHSEVVTQYIKNLQQEASFHEVTFTHFNLSVMDRPDKILTFELSTKVNTEMVTPTEEADSVWPE